MAAVKVPFQGRLEDHPLTAVLRTLLRDGSDGCLTVSRGTITRRLFLRGGMIVYGTSTEPSDRLGEILIAQGKLSRADLKRYWGQSQAGNRLLGVTLVVNGRITLSDLYQGVTAQVVTILDRIQKWRKGEYAFEAGCEPAPGTVLLCIPLALYLKADTEKKPAARKAAAPRKRKGSPPSAAPLEPAAGQPEPLDAGPAPAVSEEELIDVADEEAEAVPTLSPEAAREIQSVGEVSFLVQELRKRLGSDPYGLLGVPAGSDRAVVQAAYHRIAKVLHPDKLPRGCPPELLLEVEEIFREVTAAVQAAGNGLQQSPAAARPTVSQRVRAAPPEEDQARRFFAQGRELIAKRNYWQAADALRQAVRLRPDDPTYRQYLGLSLMQTKRLHEAEEHLVEATRLEPSNASHFVNLGRIYRGGRLFKKAREAFERALRLDPRNEHAREELADLPEEPQPGRKPESGGLLKKLFGK